ncbi:ETX/MTX2 family pore-forming toxin [Bacillus thuringiensis]|uniref:ETX/MTX2 family pore-forming toxin n=1 Tax=Bacillus thuringiensis TaxID=1428 RepID=UPI0015F33219|nr:ETX/MTX2 family pore-forming toxin [Bacillus thuringiensis]MDZ3952448.1 ETX/MTX2 family pore-forming toxin [Bacillus thuringiensis]
MIHDLKEDILDFTKWYAEKHYNANPDTFHDEKVFDPSVSNTEVVPDKIEFDTTPKLTARATDILINDTSVSQSITPKISTKTVETTSITTTEGYKIGAGIKYTSTMKLKLFLIGEISNSIEIAVTSEYNHSTSETQTNTTEKIWEYTRPVIVPPRTKVTATLEVYAGPVKVPVTLRSTITGMGIASTGYGYILGSVAYKDRGGKSWIDSWRSRSLYDFRSTWPGFKPVYVGTDGEYGVKVQGTAQVELELGLYGVVTYKEEPLLGNDSNNSQTYCEIIPRQGFHTRI